MHLLSFASRPFSLILDSFKKVICNVSINLILHYLLEKHILLGAVCGCFTLCKCLRGCSHFFGGTWPLEASPRGLGQLALGDSSVTFCATSPKGQTLVPRALWQLKHRHVASAHQSKVPVEACLERAICSIGGFSFPSVHLCLLMGQEWEWALEPSSGSVSRSTGLSALVAAFLRLNPFL